MLTLALITGCDKNDDCFEYITGGFSNINAPTTGVINEDIIIETEFLVSDSCGSFGKFIENTDGNTTTIGLQVKNNLCNGCTLAIETRTVDYTFKAQTLGDYILKFRHTSSSGEPEFIIVTITIE